MRYLLTLFEEEVMPDSRWGTYGSSSYFERSEYDLAWYDDEESLNNDIINDIARFKLNHPQGEVFLNEIIDNSNLYDIIICSNLKTKELEQEKLRLEKEKKDKEASRQRDEQRERDLKLLNELKEKYEHI
jgi:hypothetical protein